MDKGMATPLQPAPNGEAILLPSPAPEAWAGTPPAEHGESNLPYYSWLLRRYGWQIATFVTVATTAAFLYALSLPKLYQSTVTLEVAPSSTRVAGEDNAQQTNVVSSSTLLATDAQIVKSPAVVLRTMDQLHLDRHPEFLSAKDRARLSAAQARNAVLASVTGAISVVQPSLTLLMNIQFRARSPQLAAQVANSLAQSFLELEYKTRAQALENSSKYMTAQLTDLKAEMERNEEALVNYESAHDVLDPTDKTNVMQSRLSQVNQEFTTAEAARIQAEADYDTMRADPSRAALLTAEGAAELQPLLRTLQQDQRQLADMATVYGPNYFLYRQQAQAVANDQNLVHAEEQRILGTLQSHYQAAVTRANLLQAALAQQKKALDAFNLRAIQYSD
jgi:succinoglycan biosynthesis transport protein ExoP